MALLRKALSHVLSYSFQALSGVIFLFITKSQLGDPAPPCPFSIIASLPLCTLFGITVIVLVWRKEATDHGNTVYRDLFIGLGSWLCYLLGLC
jgi:hypothetical protein